MKIILIILSTLFLFSCEKSTEPVTTDGNAKLVGKVIDINGNPLDSVIVGFTYPNIPDSIIFIGDSLVLDIPRSIEYQSFTGNDGMFEIGFGFAIEPPVDFDNMFAYKPGQELWRFSSNLDSVFRVRPGEDSITVQMNINDCYQKPEFNEITLYDHLLITFPKNYGCSEGLYTSEDTHGFLKNRKDYEVTFHWELGMTPFFPKEFDYLPTAEQYEYPNREIFFVDADSAALYYFHPINKRGIALIKNENKTKYRELLFVDFKIESLDEVMQILNTIRYKH
ncbi:MAG: hypothetical protein HND52_19255 [Ignavibacteriae bacterium]|nr:hypothetical protein [Ignavibacteriota bacterium]NOH00105.1 hypothetical protein [Ignavibacteriota bacterium]